LIPEPSFLGASILLAGALLSLLVGIMILPISVPAIALLGLGLLGFLPFFCAAAWLRQGLSLYQAAAAREPRANSRWRLWLGIPAVLTLFFAGQRLVDRAMVVQTERLLSGNPTEAREARTLMKGLIILRDPLELAEHWGSMDDGPDREQLGARIRHLTGHDPWDYMDEFWD